jgi:hypothetical protein
MSESENDTTYISFSSISKGIENVLDFKLQVDAALKNFSDSVNSLSASIILYNKQLRTQHANNSICSSDGRKKKFCSKTNNNVNESNNNKAKNCGENSLYYQTDKQGRIEFHKGETELEKAERLLEYQKIHVEKLKEKQKRAALKNVKELDLNIDNNNNIVDINNNILYTRNNNSDTSTIITSNPSSTDTTTKKNIVPNHSTSTPQDSIRISKSVITTISNNKNKKNETRITKERKLKPESSGNMT